MSSASGKLKRQEPIKLTARRHGHYPKRFIWRGVKYEVTSVQEVWTRMQRKGPAKGTRHYFRVRCREGTFQLIQDAARNAWYIAP